MNVLGYGLWRGCRPQTATLGRILFSLVALSALVFALDARAEPFVLTSPDYAEGDRMRAEHRYYGFGCNGENISPHLKWSGAPEGTRSFALVMHDPDAPTGSGWWHWVVFNIPAQMRGLPEGSGDPKNGLIPEAIQSRTDFGSPGYGGACPPEGHGEHRYQFRVYALKVEQLPLDENSPAAMVAYQINANKLAEAQLELKFGR
ncbi:YbhB/YbcL family Raf kinase inhibitor-like protein [Microbulbifer elongatus]|uniref:YbhB/YbcL family Raf kinase inhibitor-like protein n=1 Tax=Microbulbifer elongatus TaxID=86173 RepID=A0ABT1P4Q7_9GAMM|nr:YbhB/YbcL family Raf kinase inhibitor-like protein [Microbulbifer elongatus]MCQ3831070.1 YbhB/YbcL family Raf kinase inhibitor-like protein [Microbulbifer elongatus]